MAHFSQTQYSIVTFVGLALLLTGITVPSAGAVALIGALVLLLASSIHLAAFVQSPIKVSRFAIGLIVSLSLLMIMGCVVYYLGQVTPITLGFVVALLPFAAFALTRAVPQPEALKQEKPQGILSGFLVVLLLLTLVLFFKDLSSTVITDPVRSPWLILPPSTLVWFGIASGITAILAIKGSLRSSLFASCATFFAAVSVAAMVFPLGYGFDPFLHRATVEHIALNGTITPKPFYYIGQYILELVPVLFGTISAGAIDGWLVPALAALLLPSLSALAVWHITKRPRAASLAAFASLLMPLAGFINTTPQSLANLWSISLLLLALPVLASRTAVIPWRFLLPIAVAALLIHPLAGLPTILFLTLAYLASREQISSTVRSTGIALVSLAGSVMLPLAFIVSGPGSTIGLNLKNLTGLIPETFFSTRYQLFGDLLATLGVNQWLWLLALALAGGLILRTYKTRAWLVFPLTATTLFVNALILSAVGDFSFLIDYEQTNYVDRVVQFVLFSLLPLSIVGISIGSERLLELKHQTVRIGLFVLLTWAATASMFVAYPRHDAYSVSRGFNVGQSDYDTVASIASDAQDTPYVVLANQAVSAAAISQNGFLHYYGEGQDVFYYPVPTGGPLYEIFLEMIEEAPTRQVAKKAAELTGVDRIYFVVNDYWWSADRAVEQAKVSADDWFQINDGATTVFLYSNASAATN